MAKKKNPGEFDVYAHRNRTETFWWDMLVVLSLIALAGGWLGLMAWGLLWLAGVSFSPSDST